MIDKAKIESILSEYDFSDFRWIDPRDIVVARWVRVKCVFGCSDYGLGTCPPNTPEVSECERFFREYSNAIIIRLNKFADKDHYPSAWSGEMTDKLLGTERKIFLSGYPKVFLLNQTCCSLCDDCPGTRSACRDKKKARPSPESFAVDVYQTAGRAGLEIHVVDKNPGEMNRIAILMVD